MLTASLSFGLLLLLLIVYAVFLYYRLARLRRGLNEIKEDLDGLMEQRQAELPGLMDTCQRYMPHERTALERLRVVWGALTRVREQDDPIALAEVENWLTVDLGQLLALTGNYPQVQADEGFRESQRRILDLQRRIADRRERYNAVGRRINARLAGFPAALVGGMLGFETADLLEPAAEHDARADTDART